MIVPKGTVYTEELVMIELEDSSVNVLLERLDCSATWRMLAPVTLATLELGVTRTLFLEPTPAIVLLDSTVQIVPRISMNATEVNDFFLLNNL